MLTRLRKVLPFIYIPLSIILGANLVGLVSTLLIPFLDHSSRIVWPFFHNYWFIFLTIGWCLLACLLSGYTDLHCPTRRYEIKRFPILRFFSVLILLCFSLSLLAFMCVFIYELLLKLFTTQFFKKYNLIFFQLLVLAILQFALRPHALQSMTWKKLRDLWMKPPTISTISIGGFGFIATSDAIKNPLLQLTLKSDYTNLPLILPTALFGVLVMVLAIIVERIGRTKSPDDEGNIPQGWFYTTFGLAFGGNVAMFGLLLNSIFLTIHTHYMIQFFKGT